MSLFQSTLRKLIQPHDLHQVNTDIDYHLRCINAELIVEHRLAEKLQRYCALLEEAKKLYARSALGDAGVGAAYEQTIRAAHALTLDMEHEIEWSKLPKEVKGKWLNLIFKD